MRNRMMFLGTLVAVLGLWSMLGVLFSPLAKALIAIATWEWQAEALTPAGRAITAIAGGVMLGWGVMLFELGRAGDLPNASLVRIVRAGVLTWFVGDSLASVAAGAAPNVVPNVLLLALAWWATLEPRRSAAQGALG